jgi:hypothetical protein
MNNDDLRKYFKILIRVTLVVLVLTIILPLYELPSWPVIMLYSIFIAEFARRTQSKSMPEIDNSWKEIFKFVYASEEERFGMASPGITIERYFNKLRTEVPTVYYADAIPRLSDTLPEQLQAKIKDAQHRYGAMVGIHKMGTDANEIMRDRVDYPDFIKPGGTNKTIFSEACIEFCALITGAPDLLVRIVVIGEYFSNTTHELSSNSRLEVVRNLRSRGTPTGTALANDYLIKFNMPISCDDVAFLGT